MTFSTSLAGTGSKENFFYQVFIFNFDNTWFHNGFTKILVKSGL